MKKTLTTLLAGLVLSTSALAAPTGKVLIVLSGVDYITMKGGVKHPTGTFLSELTGVLKAVLDQGYEVTFATPGGTVPVFDKVSDKAQWYANEAEYQAAKELVAAQPGLSKPVVLENLTRAALDSFDGLFLPGGHASMEDLPRNAAFGAILRYFHETGKPTALICHAPTSLVAASIGVKDWIYSGYKMIVFSTAEEQQEENAGHLDGLMVQYPVDMLKNAGGIVSGGAPWTSNVIRDRELITGQNPMSDAALARLFTDALAERILSR